MTQKLIVGGAFVGAAAALLMSFAALRRTSGLAPLSGDDQPMTMGGGSLHLRSEVGWTLERSNTPATVPHRYKYDSAWPVEKVEWACSNDSDDITISTRNNGEAAVVDLAYINKQDPTKFQSLKYFTLSDGKELRIQILRANGKTVGIPMLRQFIELGEHPRSKWDVDSITSTGLNPNISCTNVGGDFYLKIRPCTGPGCN